MIQCPKCKADLLDDSNYCDQCGEKLMFCPKCGDRQPRRGKRCTQCGSLLSDSHQQPSQSSPQSTQQPTPAGQGMSMDDIFSQFGDIFGGGNIFGGFAKAQQSSSYKAPEQDTTYHSPIFGDYTVKGSQPSQPSQSSTMRPGQQGGTMRPGQQQGGTMRPGQQAPEPPLKLVMLDNPAKVAVLKNGAIIGRTAGDYVNVFGCCQYVSGTHAKVVQNSDGSWLLSDLGSTNGTKVGTFVFEPNKFYKLKKGMIVEIGLVKFKVE